MVLSPEDLDSLLRLAAAAAIGMVIGINRDLRGKPTGMRTLGLVSTGAALAAIAALRVEGLADHPDALSRVVQGIIQGILTGIGFLGAGVILRDRRALAIHGLTTAATVWITAALGIACALGSWFLIAVGFAITLLLLVVARPLEVLAERWADRRHGGPAQDGAGRDPPPADPA